MDLSEAVGARSQTTIVVPVPNLSGAGKPQCPPLGHIRGKKIGLRRDQFWLAWDYVTDEWAQLLEKDGAKVVIWRAPIEKSDQAAKEGGEKFRNFLENIDAMVTGLCNCGSCTLWAIHDGVAALDRGMPTLTTCTSHFVSLAQMLAKKRGHGKLRVKLLPYPLEGRPEPEIRQIARENYDSMLEAFGAVR